MFGVAKSRVVTVTIRAAVAMSFAACQGSTSDAPLDLGDASSSDAGVTGHHSICPMTSEESPMVLATPGGDLHGTMSTPAGCGPFPVALLIAGSGPTDRDGNSGQALATNAYLEIARWLVERGVASLRYDKRGIGESAAAAPPEAELRFETYVEDAASWLNRLNGDGRFGTRMVIGHSEGALLGTLAAQKEPLDALVLLAGAGRPASLLLREQLGKQLTGPLLDEAIHIVDELENGREVGSVSPELDPLFRPTVQPYLVSWFKYDPAQEIAKVSTRTLIVQGTTDLQVGVADAQLLGGARPDAVVLIIDDMSHVLKVASLDPAAQQAAYSNPALPLAPRLLDGLGTFINAVLER